MIKCHVAVWVSVLLLFTTGSLLSQSNEEATIRKVIEEAGNGAYTNDYQKWSSHWSEKDILFHYANEAENYLFEDWPTLAAQMRENTKSGPSPEIPYVERSNYKTDTPENEIQLVKEKFQGMVPLIDGMEAAIWMDAPDANSPYNHSLMLEFTNEAAVKAYEAHANHRVAIEKWQQFGDKLYGHTYQDK